MSDVYRLFQRLPQIDTTSPTGGEGERYKLGVSPGESRPLGVVSPEGCVCKTGACNVDGGVQGASAGSVSDDGDTESETM